MYRRLIVIAAAASMSASAMAADLPVKAIPPVNLGLQGFYFGVDASGGLNHDQLTAALAATTFRTAASGMGGGVRFGYAKTLSPRTFVMIEGGVTRQNVSGDVACGAIACSSSSKWRGDFGVDVATDIPALANLIPDILPTSLFPVGAAIPPGATNPTTHPIVGAFVNYEQVDAVVGASAAQKALIQPGVRFGLGTKVTSNAFLKTMVQVTFSPNKFAIDPIAMPNATLNAGTTITGRISLLTGANSLTGLLGF